MARALSDDLRERVLEAGTAGTSARSIAARFGIGVSTAILWLRRERESSERSAPKPYFSSLVLRWLGAAASVMFRIGLDISRLPARLNVTSKPWNSLSTASVCVRHSSSTSKTPDCFLIPRPHHYRRKGSAESGSKPRSFQKP